MSLWPEGMECEGYVINRMSLSPTNMKPPYEILLGHKPDGKHLKSFWFSMLCTCA